METAAISPPRYPAIGTQPGRLLKELLQGKAIDPLYGWKTIGIYRLSDTVFQLRQLGWPVITGHLQVRNRFGENSWVAQYFLAHDAIVRTGSAGQEYVRKAQESLPNGH